jgi:hypothetical protein
VFLCILYVFTKKIYKYVFIRYLESITQVLNLNLCAYFGLDSRECKCLEYLFIYFYIIADVIGGKTKTYLMNLFVNYDT